MERKKLFFKKMKKLFIFPLLVFVSLFLFSAYLYANADEFVNQEAPFIIQGTATNNNTTIDPVGDHSYLVEKRGHSEVVNGEIVDANGRYLVNIGRNIWNEQWEIGGINGSDGLNVDSADDQIRSIDYISVVPNRSYYVYCSDFISIISYDSSFTFISNIGVVFNGNTFITPINCQYIRFKLDGTTYNNDITISLYYDDEAGYDEYYPYQELAKVDTGVEVLRSAGNAYDVKTSNGVIVRNISIYTFTGNETISDWGNGTFFFEGLSSNIVSPLDNSVSPNLLCDALSSVPYNQSTSVDGTISIYGSGSPYSGFIFFYDSNISSESAWKSFLAGKTIYYQVVTPSQEQGTSFNQFMYVDDFGSMYWLDTNNVLISLPQGNRITYVYNFVYAWYEPILRAITVSFKKLGGSIIDWIKDGFVQLFTNVEVVEGVNVYHPSEVAYFTFILMGIALACGLTYFIVRLLRRSR